MTAHHPYQTLYDSAPFTYFVLTPAARILKVNQFGAACLGYTPDELIGQLLFDFCHPEDRSRNQAQFNQFLQQPDQMVQWEVRYIRKDQTQLWFKESAHQIIEADGTSLILLAGADISDRKQAEVALQESEEKYRLLFSNELDAVSLFEVGTGKLLDINHAFLDLYGYSREEALSLTVSEISAEPAHTKAAIQQASLSKGKSRVTLRWHKKKDGTAFPVELCAGSFLWQGRLVMCAVIRDMTERIQAEAALSQRVERERALNHVIQTIRNSLNLETIFATAVDEIGKLLQVDRAAIVQYLPEKKWWLNVAEHRQQANLPSTLGFHISDEGNEIATRLKRSEIVLIDDVHPSSSVNCGFSQMFPRACLLVPLHFGSVVWGSLSLMVENRPYVWQDSEVELSSAIADQLAIAIQQSRLYWQIQQLNSDLEQQVEERTEQLRQSLKFEATLKRVTDKVRDSLDEQQILQTVVHELGLVLKVSCCDAALYDLEQQIILISYEYTTEHWPSAQGRVIPIEPGPGIHSCLLQGQCLQFCRMVPRFNRPRSVILACPMVGDQGILGDLWLFRSPDKAFDESEIRLVQQVANQCAIAIRQARLYQAVQGQVEELEKLNGLKDEFLSTVSHELRTPMSNIRMAIQMMELTLQREGLLDSAAQQAKKPSKVTPYLKILQDECRREINLINNLLDLQRLEAEAQPLNYEPIKLQSWLPRVVEPFQERMQAQQQSLELILAADLPSLISDMVHLERIIAELLNNACKYTPSGGKIAIAVDHSTPIPEPTAHSLDSGSQWQIKVMNFGVEIPAKEIPHVFKKFYRVPSNDPWKQGGTGLGLALVQRLVENLGGTITLTSGSNQTCFTIELLGPDPQRRS